MNTDELLTTSEAILLLRVSRTTLYNFIRRGVITPRGLGRTNYYIKSELLELLRNSEKKLAS